MLSGKKLLKVSAIIMPVAIIVGCTLNSNNTVPYNPQANPGDVSVFIDSQFDDIPVPEQYFILRDKSYSFQGSRFRNALFYYEGNIDLEEALKFYQDQMPISNWIPVETERGVDYVMLKYQKGNEQSILVLREIPGGSRAEIQVDNVNASSLLNKKTENKVIK